MDPSFFGLDGHPFDSSYDRDEACLTDTHASLISELRAGLKAPHGITLLIGEEGTGKTRLIRRFADELADDCKVAYLPTTGPGLRHLLTEIIEQLGGSPPAAAEESSLHLVGDGSGPGRYAGGGVQARGADVRRIGAFGGTFDPVHRGHLVPAVRPLETFRIERLVFVPAGRPPHKRDEPLTAFSHRFAMLALATQPYDRLFVSDVELDGEGPTYTIVSVDDAWQTQDIAYKIEA